MKRRKMLNVDIVLIFVAWDGKCCCDKLKMSGVCLAVAINRLQQVRLVAGKVLHHGIRLSRCHFATWIDAHIDPIQILRRACSAR
jgi:hypothetical protein